MENPENSDRKIEVIIRCIHPNLNWTPQEGPDYSTFYPAMTTLVEDFRARVQSKILFRSAFFKAILEKDIQVFSKGKAIEVKLTSRKHQVSVESMLMCLDYLDHLSLFEIDIHRKNMLALLVTANFLKIEQLENYFADFVGNNLKSKHVIDIANIASQIKNFRLLDKAYVFDQMKLPDTMRDDKDLVFNPPFMEYTKTGSKVNLEIFAHKADEIQAQRRIFHEVTNQYNMMCKVFRRIERTRAEESIMGNDYPHTYRLIREHDSVSLLYAERWSDSGNFTICRSQSHAFSDEYVGVITNNFLGHEFKIYDHGVEEKLFKKLPTGFIKNREQKMHIKFETNILGENPRTLNVNLVHEETKESFKLKNLPPKWNQRTECYTLNFYGRVSRASAKNFQLVTPGDSETVYLLFGKIGTESFHLDYRAPLTMFQAFCIALSSLARKRVVS